MGPTKAGKTWLAADLLALRGHVVVLAGKPKDETFKRFVGYRRQRVFSPTYGQNRYFVWKEYEPEQDREAAANMAATMRRLYKEGWTVYYDDLTYQCDDLGLAKHVKKYYKLGRTSFLTNVASLQRPVWVPREVLSQSGHVLIMRIYDDDDIARVASATGKNKRELAAMLHDLTGRSFIWIQNIAGEQPVVVQRGG